MKSVSSARVLVTSFSVDILDILLNVILALISGSAVMLVQALRGAADLLTSGLLIVGLKRARRKADPSHPFGYGKEIYFWTLMSALGMLAITATYSIEYGWEHFWNPQPLTHTSWALGVLVIGVITNVYALSLSVRRLRAAEHTPSIIDAFQHSSLIETKAAFVLDLMGTVGGLFGIASLGLYLLTGNSQFDGLGAMVIGVSIGVLAILLVWDVRDLLIGRSAPLHLEDDIRDTALAIKGVEKVLDLRTMYIGADRILVNLELNFAPHLHTEQIERLIDIIKAEVKSKVPSVHHIQVELETPHKKKAQS